MVWRVGGYEIFDWGLFFGVGYDVVVYYDVVIFGCWWKYLVVGVYWYNVVVFSDWLIGVVGVVWIIVYWVFGV